MIKQEFIGASGILLPGAITIPKGEEIAISQDWLIFPEAIVGEGKVWTIDGLLWPCIKLDNEVWVDSNVENPFSEPIIYKGKNTYGWLVGEVPEDVTNELAYIDRKSVRNIILSNYITELLDDVFYLCNNLHNIIVPNNVTTIGNRAFYKCTSLSYITFPNSITTIGDDVFYGCSSITYPIYNAHCFVYMPNSYSGAYTIPEGITQIAGGAFYGCSLLTAITIADSVTSIGFSTFYNNLNIEKIVSYAENPPIIKHNTFAKVDKEILLEVPNADLYKVAPYWDSFYNITTINPYKLNVYSNNEDEGIVAILEHNTTRSVIQAYNKLGYAFKQWSDGNTDLYRELYIVEDTTLIAEFEKEYQCTINSFLVVNCTPTSVAINFKISCDDNAIEYANNIELSIQNDDTFISVDVSQQFGELDLIIRNLHPNTTYNIHLTVYNNTFTSTSMKLEFATPELNNKFSVSADKQVTFSKGNLQYTQSTNTWSFAENQYDYIGTDNVTGGSVYSDTNGDEKYGDALADKVDLFGWSTSATYFGVSTSEYDSDYLGSFVDWGTNKIGNDAPNTWRTLTKDEWEYLLNHRNNASSLWGVAQVNGVNGLIFLPDNWVCPAGVTFQSGFHSNEGVDYYAAYQTFTAEQWSKLESAGAVFLPASGYRSGSGVYGVQGDGDYWSATEKGSDFAYHIYLGSVGAGTTSAIYKFGHSVRLIKDLN